MKSLVKMARCYESPFSDLWLSRALYIMRSSTHLGIGHCMIGSIETFSAYNYVWVLLYAGPPTRTAPLCLVSSPQSHRYIHPVYSSTSHPRLQSRPPSRAVTSPRPFSFQPQKPLRPLPRTVGIVIIYPLYTGAVK